MAGARPLVTRALLAALLAAPLALAGPARAGGPPPVDGRWVLAFTATSVDAVGEVVPRHDESCGDDSCEAAYQFTEHGVGPESKATLSLRLDASGCAGPPCDIRAVPAPVAGLSRDYVGTVHYDGTTYAGSGGWFSAGSYCDGRFDGPKDTFTFTTTGPPDAPTLTGEASVVLSYVATTVSGTCGEVKGYEVYHGTFTGTRSGPRPSGAALPGPDAGAAGGPAADAPAADISAAGARAVRADRAAARGHARPVLSTAVADARSLPWSPLAVLTSALLALLLVALLPFPAALFNSTLEANYAEVRGWFRFLPERPQEEDATADPRAARRPWPAFLGLVLAAALLNAFLDPDLRADRASTVLVVSLAVSILAVTLLGGLPARAYVRRRYAETPLVRTYPLGLLVAALCVLVSRLTSFEPGYLYGVVGGFAFRRALATDEKGRLHVRTAAFLLATAAAAFAVRVPVHAATVRSGSVWLAVADTTLAAVFAAGVEGNVLALLPLRFLPGEELYGWSRVAWGAMFGLSAFAFLHALSAPSGDATTRSSVTVAVALFAVFATVSVTFWAYFRYRPAHPTPASV